MFTLVLVIVATFVPSIFAEYESQQIVPTTLASGDQYGYFAAASENLVVITAPYSNNSMGSAYVYNCPTAESCQQTQILTAPNAMVNDTFGINVAVSGSLVVVGALKANFQGVSYIFNCSNSANCILASTITLSDGAPGDWFGYYAFAYESWVIIGAPGRKNETGEAFIYDCTQSTSCTKQTNLTAPDASPGSWFGLSTGMYGWLAVVGADGKNNGNGGAYAFNCSNPKACTLLASLSPTNVTGGYFGAFLFVSRTIVYITAAFNDNTTGYTYVYDCGSGTNCTLESTLQPASLRPGDEFGAFVVAYEETVVISAQLQNDGAGSVYVFDCSDPANCMQVNYLNASDAAPGDNFGFALAITDQFIVSTAPYKNQKKGEFYTYSMGNQTSMP